MNAIQQVALAPRLSYSKELLRGVMDALQQYNLKINSTEDHTNDDDAAIKQKYTIIFCIEALDRINHTLNKISSMDQIPDMVPPTIGVLRMIGVKISTILPHCNNTLCEMAVHLGSVSVDSALLKGIDIKYQSLTFQDIIDSAEVSAGKKLQKLYPDLVQ